VIDLAVGIIIGAAFTAIVNSLVADLFNPILGLLMGGIDFSNLFIVLSGERGPTLEATRESGAAVIAIGLFINACINFVIVGFAIFWLIKVLSRFKEKEAAAAPAAPPKSELLLEEIRDIMKSRTP
jgi:large conductance mechanosensitive channel